jgi:hypothetical protein
MLFTVITFFQKFALILFFTVIMASLGSFVFLLTFLDCIGPSNPTFLADKCLEMFCKSEGDSSSQSPSRFDIVIGEDKHTGTEAFRVLVGSFIRNQRNKDDNNSVPAFSPAIHDAILEEYKLEHRKVKGPSPKVYVIDPAEENNGDGIIRMATKKEKTEFIRACYVEQI